MYLVLIPREPENSRLYGRRALYVWGNDASGAGYPFMPPQSLRGIECFLLIRECQIERRGGVMWCINTSSLARGGHGRDSQYMHCTAIYVNGPTVSDVCEHLKPPWLSTKPHHTHCRNTNTAIVRIHFFLAQKKTKQNKKAKRQQIFV